jgi:hypothetical protein
MMPMFLILSIGIVRAIKNSLSRPPLDVKPGRARDNRYHR